MTFCHLSVITIGKYGCYFHDSELNRPLTLKEIESKLNALELEMSKKTKQERPINWNEKIEINFKPKRPRKFEEKTKILGIQIPISFFEEFKEKVYEIRDNLAKGFKLKYEFIKE